MDALWRKSIRSDTTPAWTIGILEGLMGIVYFYGGLAKVNYDWLTGWPMRILLPSFDGLDGILEREWIVYFASYTGLLFDLFIVPFLIWRRTRVLAFSVAALFHLSNIFLFPKRFFNTAVPYSVAEYFLSTQIVDAKTPSLFGRYL